MAQIFFVVSFIAICSLSVIGQGYEMKIKRVNLPKRVEKTLAKESEGGLVEGIKSGRHNFKWVYRADLLLAGRFEEITIDEQGDVIEMDQEKTMESLSQPIKNGLLAAAGKGIIGRIVSKNEDRKPESFQAEITDGSKHFKITVGPNGKRLPWCDLFH